MKQIIILSCALLTLSCGARKRTVDKKERVEEVKNDISINSFASSDTSIRIAEDDFSFTLEPINPFNPIIYNRDTIYNSKVIYQRVLRDSIVRIRDTVYVAKIDKSEKRVEESEKKTNTEYEGFNWKGLNWTLLFVLLIVVGFIIWRLKK